MKSTGSVIINLSYGSDHNHDTPTKNNYLHLNVINGTIIEKNKKIILKN